MTTRQPVRKVWLWSNGLVLVWICGILFCYGKTSFAQTLQETPAAAWLTGKKLNEKLAQPISVNWKDAPIRDRLIGFSVKNRVGIFIDRRIDPGTLINLSVRQATLEQFLWAVAKQGECGVCRLDDFYYFGPLETTAALPLLWERLKNQTQKNRSNYRINWRQKTGVNWLGLVVPNEQLQSLEQLHGFKLQGPRLPRDLWQQTELPETSIEGQVAVLTAGFGMWYARSQDGKEIELVLFPEVEQGTRTFRVSETLKSHMQDLKNQFPACRLSVRGKTLSAKGTVQRLAELKSVLVSLQQADIKEEDSQRFTLNTHASRGNILATVAQQIGREFSYAAEVKEILQDRIKINVKDVTLTELLSQILADTEAQAEFDTEKLHIVLQP